MAIVLVRAAGAIGVAVYIVALSSMIAVLTAICVLVTRLHGAVARYRSARFAASQSPTSAADRHVAPHRNRNASTREHAGIRRP